MLTVKPLFPGIIDLIVPRWCFPSALLLTSLTHRRNSSTEMYREHTVFSLISENTQLAFFKVSLRHKHLLFVITNSTEGKKTFEGYCVLQYIWLQDQLESLLCLFWKVAGEGKPVNRELNMVPRLSAMALTWRQPWPVSYTQGTGGTHPNWTRTWRPLRKQEVYQGQQTQGE